MPMSFPDMDSLKQAAKVHKFRQPNPAESESAFREDLANHVEPIDFIESQEIHSGKSWDQWDERENMDLLIRALDRKPL